MSSSKEAKQACRLYRRQGFNVTKTRGGHLRFEHPNMERPVIGSSTPSDRRSIRNLHARIRRNLKH